jgi:hypothetical protein
LGSFILFYLTLYHPFLQAVGGTDPSIRIISVAEAAVIAQLPLPPGTSAVELSAAAEHPGLLLVLCKDGTLQLWQVATAVCCCSIHTDAFAAVSKALQQLHSNARLLMQMLPCVETGGISSSN